MYRVPVYLLALLTLGISPLHASEAEDLVKQLKRVAAIGAGIDANEQAVAKKLQDVGAPAIPLLIPLLQHKNKEIRDLASYTLRDMEGLTDEHLDALIESVCRGDGWIPPAIARIGTPRAVQFLFEELARQRQADNQLTWAISRLGDKAIPRLLTLYRNEKNWAGNLDRATYQIFRDLGEIAASAVDSLMKLAQDESLPDPQRIRALKAIYAIGPAAELAGPRLVALCSHQSSEIKDAATSALLSTRAKEGASIRIEQLATIDPSYRTSILRDIAEMGERGVTAGPVVLKYLDDPEWPVRVYAALALGYIRYAEAADNLIPLLKNEDDWRLVLSAARSLGHLHAERAAPALDAVGRDHWYPPVRAAAIQAAVAARNYTAGESEESKNESHFPIEFFDYEHAGQDLESIQYNEVKSIRYPSPALPEQIFGVLVKQKDGTMKKQKAQGLKIASGYLLSENHGEWGGAINFVDPKGNVTLIEAVNTHAIYQTSGGIVALTGLAHLGSNSGMLMRLYEQPDGQWTATNWRVLPGAPNFSRLLKDGRILVSCYGGIVLISPEGTMKMATRQDLGLK